MAAIRGPLRARSPIDITVVFHLGPLSVPGGMLQRPKRVLFLVGFALFPAYVAVG